MYRFVKKTFVFALIAFSIAHVRAFLLMHEDKYQKNVFGVEVYKAIEKSKIKNKAKKIVLGDSVGLQLFDSNQQNDSINSLATNQAISMAGQYILLQNYINAGNKIDVAYMVFTPFSFINNLNQIYTYNYFVKPFYNQENKECITETVDKQIAKIPFSNMASYPLIKTSNWTPNHQSDDAVDYSFLSPISVEYLHKISKLAKDNHFRIVLVSPPISKIKKMEVNAIDKNEIIKHHLENEFKDFFQSITYLNNSYFIDGTHLKQPKEFSNNYLKKIYQL